MVTRKNSANGQVAQPKVTGNTKEWAELERIKRSERVRMARQQSKVFDPKGDDIWCYIYQNFMKVVCQNGNRLQTENYCKSVVRKIATEAALLCGNPNPDTSLVENIVWETKQVVYFENDIYSKLFNPSALTERDKNFVGMVTDLITSELPLILDDGETLDYDHNLADKIGDMLEENISVRRIGRYNLIGTDEQFDNLKTAGYMWVYDGEDGFRVQGNTETIAKELNLHTCYENFEMYDDDDWDRAVKDFNLSYVKVKDSNTKYSSTKDRLRDRAFDLLFSNLIDNRRAELHVEVKTWVKGIIHRKQYTFTYDEVREEAEKRNICNFEFDGDTVFFGEVEDLDF